MKKIRQFIKELFCLHWEKIDTTASEYGHCFCVHCGRKRIMSEDEFERDKEADF